MTFDEKMIDLLTVLSVVYVKKEIFRQEGLNRHQIAEQNESFFFIN